MDQVAADQFWAFVEAFKPATLPLAEGSKKALVKWGHMKPGERVFREGAKLYGMLTGARSGGLIVLDLDSKPGADGFATLESLEAKWGVLPATLSVATPSGGLHLYFHTSERIRTVAGVYGSGLDVRGEGGLVVLGGSVGANGRTYRVETGVPVAELPVTWAANLLKAQDRPAPDEVEYVPVQASELRERLDATVRGRSGEIWRGWRRICKGERPFRIEGGPGDTKEDPVIGVDDFVSKALLWTLASTDDWHTVPPDALADLCEASFSILRQDVASIGGVSKFVRAHVADKWARACEKVAGERRRSDAFVRQLTESAAGKDSGPRPPLVQVDDRFFVLDDRDESAPRYVGPCRMAVLGAMVERLWSGRRVIEAPTKSGTRPMTREELMAAYGAPCEGITWDLSARHPSVEDLTLVLAVPRTVPEACEDPEVGRWLRLLSGDDWPSLERWIVWAGADRCKVTGPALVLLGAAHAGKSMLADGIARAAGLTTAAPLGRALGRFGTVLATHPVLFSDEGFPRAPGTGVPLTEEFRALITRVDHVLEAKGMDRPVKVRGAVRVILAANKLDRLFSGKSHVNADDVAAILRRLLSVRVPSETAADAGALVKSLGAFEGDPVRLARVAGHLRWIQVTRSELAAPEPHAPEVARELRTGSDLAAQALAALEDGVEAGEWCVRDEARGALWVKPDAWARRVDQPNAGPVLRATGAYVRTPSEKFRKHPVTGVELAGRERWASLSLGALRADRVEV